MKKFLFLPLFLYAIPVLADSPCEHFHNDYDKTYCMAKLFVESDNELNQVYNSLQAVLKKETQQQLKQVQRKWLKYRNNSCSETSYIDVECNYDVNMKRTEYLRDRLRECKTGNCRAEMITQESW